MKKIMTVPVVLILLILALPVLFLSPCAQAGEDVQAAYVDNNDGTVTDSVSALIWQQADDGKGRTWEEALAYCEGLGLAGRDDWRLPNVRELAGLVDYTRHDPAINPLLGCWSSYYWSSGTCSNEENQAWLVDFDGGGVNWNDKTNANYVRCVRGERLGLYTISGRVKFKGAGLPGATIELSGAAARVATTDSKGKYSFTKLSNGKYTITPGKQGYAFNPEKRSTKVAGANVTGQNFSATEIRFSISGKVTDGDSSQGLYGAKISLGGAATGVTYTDFGGNYIFQELGNGWYTITPSLPSRGFVPERREVQVNGSDASDQGFRSIPPGRLPQDGQ